MSFFRKAKNEPNSSANLEKADSSSATSANLPRLRQIRLTSFFFHQITIYIWWACFLSIPIDLFARYFLKLRFFNSPPVILYILLCILALGTVLRSNLFGIIKQLRDLRERRRQSLQPRVVIAMTIIVVAIILDLCVRLSAFHPTIYLAVAAIGITAIFSLKRAWIDRQKNNAKLTADRIYWVEVQNQKIFLVQALPLIATRILIFVTCLSANSDYFCLEVLLFSTPLIAAAYPRIEYFTSWCNQCGSVTSRALEGLRLCPRCAPHIFFGQAQQGIVSNVAPNTATTNKPG